MVFVSVRSKKITLMFLLIAALLLLMVATVYAATGYDLTVPGASTTLNGAIFQVFTPNDPSGSGRFNSFVRLGARQPVIRGYNTDFRPVQFDEIKSKFTRAILLSDVPQVMEENILYREFQLDIKQSAKGSGTNAGYLLTLDTVELWESSFADLCGYPFDGSGGGQTGCNFNNTATLIWDMDAITDSFVLLDYRNNAGRGKRDLRLLVPDALFNQSPNCDLFGTGCTVYVTLYSRFGGDSGGIDPVLQIPHGNNGGFEEWGVACYDVSGGPFIPIDSAVSGLGANRLRPGCG